MDKVIAGLDHSPNPGQEIKKIAKDNFYQRMDEEYAGWGGYFYGDPGMKVTFEDGVRDLLLFYHAHDIQESKDSCLLKIRMKDNTYDFYVDLYYKIYEGLDV